MFFPLTGPDTFLLVLLKESILKLRHSMEDLFIRQVMRKLSFLRIGVYPCLMALSPEDRTMRLLEQGAGTRTSSKHLLPTVWKLNEIPLPSRTGTNSRACRKWQDTTACFSCPVFVWELSYSWFIWMQSLKFCQCLAPRRRGPREKRCGSRGGGVATDQSHCAACQWEAPVK